MSAASWAAWAAGGGPGCRAVFNSPLCCGSQQPGCKCSYLRQRISKLIWTCISAKVKAGWDGGESWVAFRFPLSPPHLPPPPTTYTPFYYRNYIAASPAVITFFGIIRAVFCLKQTNKRIYSFSPTCWWILSAVIMGIYILPKICIVFGPSGQPLGIGVVIILVTEGEMKDQRG